MKKVLTKFCGKCQKTKAISEFYKNRLAPDGKSSWCKECHKKHAAKDFKQKPDYYRQKSRRQKERLYGWYFQLKSSLKCSRCPENHPACLDFHHRDPALKTLNIGTAIFRGAAKSDILEEIKKCDVLCSNCHRKLTYRPHVL